MIYVRFINLCGEGKSRLDPTFHVTVNIARIYVKRISVLWIFHIYIYDICMYIYLQNFILTYFEHFIS